MKETKIAKENVKKYQKVKELFVRLIAKEHKQTCQRWYDFLEEKIKWHEDEIDTMSEKEEDLLQAIKIYEDTGI